MTSRIRRLVSPALIGTALLVGMTSPPSRAAERSPTPSAPSVTTPEAPPGTHVRFHVNAPLSSGKSKTGQPFAFTLLLPIRVDNGVVIPAGAQGAGTLLLAGHAGSQGHEGDLTLRLDDVRMANGKQLRFKDQRFELNGRNRKAASSLLGFVPVVGYGAMLIRGSESRIDTKTPIETVLQNAAFVTSP